MNITPDDNPKGTERREVIVGGLAAIASLLIAFNPFKSTEPVRKKNMIKMLTEDGTLIEVDETLLASKGKRKITDDELKQWIKEK